MKIPKKLLKCIDPSLCLKKIDKEDEDEREPLLEDQVNWREEYGSSMLGEEDSVDMEMQSKQVGDFSS